MLRGDGKGTDKTYRNCHEAIVLEGIPGEVLDELVAELLCHRLAIDLQPDVLQPREANEQMRKLHVKLTSIV